MMPFIISHIGATRFGIYSLAYSLVNFLGLLDLGVATSITKSVAEHNAKGEKKELCELLSTMFFFYLALGVLISSILFVMGTFFLDSFKIPPSSFVEAKSVVYILAVTALFNWPLSVFQSTLAGLQRYDLTARLGMVSSFMSQFSNFLLLTFGFGLVHIVVSEAMLSVAGLMLLLVIAYRVLGYFPVSPKYFSGSTAKSLISFSSQVFILQVANQISYRVDTIVLGVFKPVAAITTYEAANKFQGFCSRINYISSSAIMPAASELSATSETDTLQKLYLKGGKFSAGLTLSVAIPLFFLAKPLLIRWLGPDFVDATVATQVFVFVWFVNAAMGLNSTVMVGVGKVKLLALSVLSKSLLNLALSIILVQKYGVLGVVSATVTAELIFIPIIMRHSLKVLKISLRRYVAELIIKPYVPAIVTSIAIYSIISLRMPSSWIDIILYGIATSGLYFMSFYLFSLNKSEKSRILDAAKQKLSRNVEEEKPLGGTTA
jgi:O-antigen/teichoic acid export membrane protein